ncbi:MAG: High-affinity branched-chain amino acid transport system permease protein LivH [Smithella sp. PtaU1.Bin162]|nr:MAG: High-affinity branched-chain amino acid transport system permease protein LivH [Smithella sp. PtaU1.Bin162]
MVDWASLLQSLANGILIAGLYAAVTLGLTLVLGVMGIVNFAHGELIMLGAYSSFWLFTLLGIDPLLSLALSGVLLFFIGTGIYRFTIWPIMKDPPLNQLLLTLGLSIFFQNLAMILWKTDSRTIITSYSGMSLDLGIIHFGLTRMITFLISVVLTVLLVVFLSKTKPGRAMQAVSENNTASWLIGINVEKTYLLAFGVAAALAGAAGALVSTVMYTFPMVGFKLSLKAFCILVIGGLGNIPGTLFGSLILGITESFVGTYIPEGSGWAEGISFVLLIVILIIKPTGLAGTRRE